MKPIINEYEIMEDAVETGVNYAMMRFFKHKEELIASEAELTSDRFTAELSNHIMNSICEKFDIETDAE